MEVVNGTVTMISTIADEGKVLQEDWYSSFPIHIKAIVTLNIDTSGHGTTRGWRAPRRLADFIHRVPRHAEMETLLHFNREFQPATIRI